MALKDLVVTDREREMYAHIARLKEIIKSFLELNVTDRAPENGKSPALARLELEARKLTG